MVRGETAQLQVSEHSKGSNFQYGELSCTLYFSDLESVRLGSVITSQDQGWSVFNTV